MTNIPPDWRSTLETLNKSLFLGLDPREAHAFRDSSLSRIAAVAFAKSSFYRERLAPVMGRRGLLLSRWNEIPLLSKDELRANREKILIADPGPHSGTVRSGWTSGSEGEPLNYVLTALADSVSTRITQRFMRWWKMDGNKRLAQIVTTRQTTGEAATPRVRRGWMQGHPAGEFHVHPVSADLHKHLAWLQEIRPAYLKTYPEVLGELARLSLRQGRVMRFELLVSGGGVLTPDIRQLCRDAFGCAVADFYGAEETGSIAAECPVCGEYHAADENLHLEILKDDGSPAGKGETGRVVVTPLFNDAFPLIRYQIGDQVIAGSGKACRQPLLTIKRVLGRSKAILTLSGGRKIWPYIPSSEMARLSNMRRFQFVQVALDKLELHYVPRDPAAGLDEALLAQLVKRFLDPSLSVSAVAMPHIGREGEFKYMLYRSDIIA